jgi:nickel-dependent lactate racemase
MDAALAEWTVIRPKYAQPMSDAEAAFRAACCQPTGRRPLREIVRPTDRVVIVTSDGTRAVPNRKLIPWILSELPVPVSQVTVLLGNGSHRANTPVEIEAMFGADLVQRVRIVNHDAFDPAQNVFVGTTRAGGKGALDRVYVEADRRIVVGFIEPHLFAGFSGGAKGIVPAVASIETILHIHGFDLIAHPLSTWGIVDENPIRRELEEMVGFCPPDLMVNVTLNSAKEITGMFVGHYIEAHRVGCAQSKREAMQAVRQPFRIVITSNSGYPLDQNLYQTVKGISAAAQITQPGGSILIASECSDGIPNHGNFGGLMKVGRTPDDVLQNVIDLPAPILDQWGAQAYAYLMQRFQIGLLTGIERGTVEACKLHPVADLQAEVEARIRALGGRPRVAVLPDGPLTIPYIG